jgi:hypothetical protein
MKHIVQFSGGTGSWAAATRLKEQLGSADDIVLMFADTLIEDEDLYRFLHEAAEDIGGELLILAEGRDPWRVFFDVRMMGSSRLDPCSRILKRDFLRKYLEEHYSPDEDVIYIGIDYEEEHRFEAAKGRWEPWTIKAPLCDRPYVTKMEWQRRLVEDHGIALPRLYDLGFPHNNCGGFCVKAGHAHFANLLRTMPERYCEHERKEQAFRDYLWATGQPKWDVSILKDRRGGKVKPLTLRALRERLEKQPDAFNKFDWGGCACFTPDSYEGEDA